MNASQICFALWVGTAFAACTAEVPIGDGMNRSALGGDGEPPYRDGTCDPGLTDCGGVCARSCSADAGVDSATESGAPDASAPDASRPDASAPDASAPDASGRDSATDASVDASATEYTLRVSFYGFPDSTGTDDHVWLVDTTNQTSISCGGGSWSSTSTETYAPIAGTAHGLTSGHTYDYHYWIDTSSFTFCSAGPVPPYYTVSIGPVTGDTSIVATPRDPMTR
jgi:hypothetical protein